MEECSAVISLLETCISASPRRILCDDPTVIPAWWKSCSVVGFDLSGNEDKTPESLEKEIEKLFKYNSPVTIHAGEAATADRVWQAVYKFHARRIGHGLRLRENPRLLRYCIDEGICMEMCPISNVSTNGFSLVAEATQYDGGNIEHYPLRHYMAAGLEVCINTDNRALHRDGTLTDEYLMAARLSGGFSRWEIFKLARAGFKHAFLPKVEVADLLSAVENRVHALAAHPDGLDWRYGAPGAH
jgi:adenosine deaminase